jgi:hypothetical protein
MKTSLALAAAVLLALPAFAAEPQTFGKVSDLKAVKLSELMAHPDTYVGKTVKVEGLITDVCSKRGCWIRLAGDKEFQTITFKVQDGVMTFPMAVKGKRAEAECVFTKIELSKEDALERARHEAEEKGQTFDPKSVTGPQVTYLLKGLGAVVR